MIVVSAIFLLNLSLYPDRFELEGFEISKMVQCFACAITLAPWRIRSSNAPISYFGHAISILPSFTNSVGTEVSFTDLHTSSWFGKGAIVRRTETIAWYIRRS